MQDSVVCILLSCSGIRADAQGKILIHLLCLAGCDLYTYILLFGKILIV